MKKIFSVLLSLLLCAAASLPALADEPEKAAEASETTDVEAVSEPIHEEAYPIIEGMDYAFVNSSVSDAGGDISYLFDGSTLTRCTMDMTGLSSRTVSIYMTSLAPFTLSALACAFSASEAVSVDVTVFGTNDSLLTAWDEIPLSTDVYEIGGYAVFTNEKYAVPDENVPATAEEPVVYQFYRVDLTLLEGNSFTVAEMVFFRPAGPLMAPVYENPAEVGINEEPVGEKEIVIDSKPAEESEEEPVEIPVEEEPAEIPVEEEPAEEEYGLRFEGFKPFIRRIWPTPKPFSVKK